MSWWNLSTNQRTARVFQSIWSFSRGSSLLPTAADDCQPLEKLVSKSRWRSTHQIEWIDGCLLLLLSLQNCCESILTDANFVWPLHPISIGTFFDTGLFYYDMDMRAYQTTCLPAQSAAMEFYHQKQKLPRIELTMVCRWYRHHWLNDICLFTNLYYHYSLSDATQLTFILADQKRARWTLQKMDSPTADWWSWPPSLSTWWSEEDSNCEDTAIELDSIPLLQRKASKWEWSNAK